MSTSVPLWKRCEWASAELTCGPVSILSTHMMVHCWFNIRYCCTYTSRFHTQCILPCPQPLAGSWWRDVGPVVLLVGCPSATVLLLYLTALKLVTGQCHLWPPWIAGCGHICFLLCIIYLQGFLIFACANTNRLSCRPSLGCTTQHTHAVCADGSSYY